MPFGLPYNEAANPRAAPVRAWLTAAPTTVTCQLCRTPHISNVDTESGRTDRRNNVVYHYISTRMTKRVFPNTLKASRG